MVYGQFTQTNIVIIIMRMQAPMQPPMQPPMKITKNQYMADCINIECFYIVIFNINPLPSDKNVNFVPHELPTIHYWNVPVQLYHKGYPQYDLKIFNGWGSLQKLDKMKFLLQLVLWAGSAGLMRANSIHSLHSLETMLLHQHNALKSRNICVLLV